MDTLNYMRINRYLSHMGVCSRREADRLIEAKRVRIGDRVAVMGDRVSVGDKVYVDDRPLQDEPESVVLAYYKPVGVICTTSDKEHPNMNDVIDYPDRVFPIGRLDKDSSGLLLLTNDGLLAEELMRGRNAHEKEYLVHTDKPITEPVRNAMEQGVPLEEHMTRPCKVEIQDDNTLRIILTEGMNRQIRRMCEYFGYRVVSLKRVRVVNIFLGDMREGELRKLSDDERKKLTNG